MEINSILNGETDPSMDAVINLVMARLRAVESSFMTAAANEWCDDVPAWAVPFVTERQQLIEMEDYLSWAADELATIERFESDEAEMRARGALV